MTDSFHALGSLPVDNDLLNNLVIAGAIQMEDQLATYVQETDQPNQIQVKQIQTAHIQK